MYKGNYLCIETRNQIELSDKDMRVTAFYDFCKNTRHTRMESENRLIVFRSGQQVCPLGQGTYQMGRRRSEEIHALRLGIELGLTLIDTWPTRLWAKDGCATTRR